MSEDEECYTLRLDLGGQNLKKLTRALFPDKSIKQLLLDNNEIQRLENIDQLTELQELSATHNQLIRMYGVARLTNLTSINLAHNGIVIIEGLRELTKLRWLSLAGNSIKSIEHLNTNIALEHLDLSENNIPHISDLSFLKNLRELYLHGNKIPNLQFCERYLPSSLRCLTLANNQLTDLNEISQLSHLAALEELTIINNPCVCMTGECVGFDYRPFVINWCMSLRSIDNYVVDAKESLRAEWLYSQGRGRQFRVGDQSGLVDYLAVVCPLSGRSLQTEEEQKLLLILSKAQQHQRQLWEETSQTGVERSCSASAVVQTESEQAEPTEHVSPKNSAFRQRQGSVKRHSPRTLSGPREHRRSLSSTDSPLHNSSYIVELPVSLYGSRARGMRGAPPRGIKAADIMAVSADAAGLAHTQETAELVDDEILMTRSLDPELLVLANNGTPLPADHVRPTQLCTDNGDGSGNSTNNQLKAASKLVPVPETIMSPDYRPATARTLPGGDAGENVSRVPKIQRPAGGSMSSSTIFINDKGTVKANPGSKPDVNRNMSASWSPYAEKKIHKSAVSNNDMKGSPTPSRNRLLTYATDRPWHKDNATNLMKSPRRSAGLMSRSLSVEPGRRGSLHRPAIVDKKSNTPSPTRRRGSTAASRLAHNNDDSSDDSEMSVSKLETIKNLAVERKERETKSPAEVVTRVKVQQQQQQKLELANSSQTITASEDTAAVTIQRVWRGFHTRNLNCKGVSARQELRTTRVEDHVRHLTKELQAAKSELEMERKLRLLQMEAIKALWKEVQNLQPKSPRTPQAAMSVCAEESNRDSGVDMSPLLGRHSNKKTVSYASETSGHAVLELSKTCSVLQGQVERLQDSLESVVRCMSSFCQLSAATQTVEGPAELMTNAAFRHLPQVKCVGPQVVVPPTSECSPEEEIRDTPSQTDITAVVTEPSEDASTHPKQQQQRSLLSIPTRSSGTSPANGTAKSRPSFLPIFYNGKNQDDHKIVPCRPLALRNVPEQVHLFAKSLVDNLVKTAVEKAESARIDKIKSSHH